MDFGSFLRQRQQKKQLGSANNGNTGNSSMGPWAVNEPYSGDGAGRGIGPMNDSVFFDGPESDVRSWNQSDPYQQETDNFDVAGPVADPYSDPTRASGKGFRGRGRGSNAYGGSRGRGIGSYIGEFKEPDMENSQHWDPSSSLGQLSNYGDGSGYYEVDRGNDQYGYGAMETTNTGQDVNMSSQQLSAKPGSVAHALRNELVSQNVAVQEQGKNEEASNEKAETKKKRVKEQIVKTEEEMKALEEFDIMQVNINWGHFGITKKMLAEVAVFGKQPVTAKKNYDTTKLEFYCKLCDVQTISAGNLYSHLIGKKHKLRVENEIDSADTIATSESKDNDDEDVKTYGGTIGFVLKEDNKDQQNDDEDEKKDIDTAYEKDFYENSKNKEMNIDWESAGITPSMLHEASFEARGIKYEDRCFDFFQLHYYCRLCDIQSTSLATFYDHLSGKKHKSKFIKEMRYLNNPEDEDAKEDFEMTEHEKDVLQNFDLFAVNLNWSHYKITKQMLMEASTEGIPGLSQKKRKKKEIDLNRLEFYCKLCASQMVSAGNFHDHLVGKRHAGAYQEHIKGISNPEHNLQMLKPEELGKKSIFDEMFKDIQKPVIGLDYIMEMHSNFDIWCICTLCALKFRAKASTQHILGVKHRLYYLRKRHTDDYEKLKALHEKNLPIFKELVKLGGAAEESDGRGKSVIKFFDKPVETDSDTNTNFKLVHEFMEWVATDFDDAKAKFKVEFQGRPMSPILKAMRSEKHDEKSAEMSKEVDKVGNDYLMEPDYPASRSSHSPPMQGGRPPRGRGKPDFSFYEKERPYPPPLLPLPQHFDRSLKGDLPQRDRFLDREPFMRDRFMDRDPLFRDRFREQYLDRDPLMRERFMDRERDPLLRERFIDRDRDLLLRGREMDRPPRLMDREMDLPPSMRDRGMERDPLMRDRGMDRDSLMRDRGMDRDPLSRDRGMDRDPLSRDRGMDRDPLSRDRGMDRDPLSRDRGMDRDPLSRDRDLGRDPYMRSDPLSRDRLSDPYRDPDLRKPRPDAQTPYLDPDPLKRVIRKPGPDPNPPSRTMKSEPYIDPDPLKRILPSQKAKAKPVVIDYGHGKEEKSEKSKAKEWEDDINDILDGGRNSKGPDSLALLNSSYSSPKRDRSRTPPRTAPTKPLPFEKSYLDRAKDHDLLPRKSRPNNRGQDSAPPYPRRRNSRSPEYLARNPDYPTGYKIGPERKRSFSPPFKNKKVDAISNLESISISSESPPLAESPSKPDRYVKSPKFKRSRKSSRSPKFKTKRKSSSSRSRSSSSSSSSSSSRSSSSSPPRSGKYKRPKRSRSPPSILKYPCISSKRPSPPRSSPSARQVKLPSASFTMSKKSRSKSPPPPLPKSLPPSAPLPKSAPLPPLPPSLPPGLPPLPSKNRSPISRPPRSSSPGNLPATLPPRPPQSSRSPPRKVPRANSPPGSLPKSLPPMPSPPKARLPSPPPPRCEPKKPAPLAHLSDEDAQAERIAEMLLSMKGSIVGSEMNDPHAALQALLSSKELSDALLGSISQASSSHEREERRSSGQSSLEPESGRSSIHSNNPPPPKSTNSREKIAFSFAAGKINVATRNVPQTFMDEESSDEDD